MLRPGIYEQIINRILQRELHSSNGLVKHKEAIEKDESSRILSRYLAEILERVLVRIRDEKEGVFKQVDLVNKLVELIGNEIPETSSDPLFIDTPLEKLLALFDSSNNGSQFGPEYSHRRPETSISQTSLFTSSEDEPNMVDELRSEILSSDRIDMLVSFIKWSGMRLLVEQLKTFTENGGRLRVITTSYLGATDSKAIEELTKLNNTEIKISYDTKRTRLHAKAYIFQRNTGFSTAYVGSSNLSNIAISSGLEWNVKIASKELPDTMSKINATFDSYWNSNEFETYRIEEKGRLIEALNFENTKGKRDSFPYLFDIRPYPFQQEILDKLEAERTVLNKKKNLIVAATGTGKTVISAFDYKRFCVENRGKPNRLLFIAHREEILKQSIVTFRGVLKDYNFGDLSVGNYKANGWDHLFVSIQTFNSQRIDEKTTPDHYDFIVIDEFHHAAAKSYKKLISYYNPKVLLGLTATPERSDGISVTRYFEDRISAEIRLHEAIDRKLLSPFQYFGVTDSVDLKDVTWKREGYDEAELTKLYALDQSVAQKRASQIVASLHKYLTDLESVKGLGFCVSVKHAEFMANFFNSIGVESIFLTGESPEDERKAAKKKVVEGEIKFIFVVDIYNEGVDIPEINTILFLRPTQSLTVFLQQLGRGLRLAEGKECLTVLDFVGQANKKYDFEEKFAALVSKSNRSIQKQVKDGFTHLPRGSYIQLERKAKEYILDNIRRSFGVKSGLVSRIASFEEDTGLELTLENFLIHYHLEPLDIYSKGSFSRLCVDAKIMEDFNDPEESTIAKALQRVSAIDSRRWIRFMVESLRKLEEINSSDLSNEENRMLSMFHYTIWQRPLLESGFTNLKESMLRLKRCGPLFEEIIELLEYNLTRIDFLDEPVDLGFDCPLDLHCSYTRDQILIAMDYMKPGTIREGVKFFPDKMLDLLFITLNKSDKDYSPTTMYNDYSINNKLFHWQSQSTTSETSETGQRYINHVEMGSKVLLFVREYKRTSAGGGAPYTFLGLGNYVKHEGSNPMNIVWELERPIPAKYVKKTNKLYAV